MNYITAGFDVDVLFYCSIHFMQYLPMARCVEKALLALLAESFFYFLLMLSTLVVNSMLFNVSVFFFKLNKLHFNECHLSPLPLSVVKSFVSCEVVCLSTKISHSSLTIFAAHLFIVSSSVKFEGKKSISLLSSSSRVICSQM